MAQGRVKQFSVRSNESAPDEMAQYSVKLYSTTSNGTAFREIAWHTFRRCSLRSRTQLGVKWYSVTSNGTALREMVQHTSRLFRAIISERNIFRTSSAMQCMKHSIWNNRVLNEGTKCSSVKLGLGGVTSVRRNHQKYKTRMEQPRVNWDRGQYDVTLVTFWRQTLRKRDPPASCIVVTLLPYFVSQSSADRCDSTITAYVISLNISTQNPDILYISMCYLLMTSYQCGTQAETK